jgi:hypothetical protein
VRNAYQKWQVINICYEYDTAGRCINTNAILQHATALLATGVAFATCFVATQVTHQVTVLNLVVVDVLVNALGTNGDGNRQAFARRLPTHGGPITSGC